MNTEHPIGDPIELAADYLAGAMTDDQTALFESHLAQGCELCQRKLRELDRVAVELLANTPPVNPPPGVLEALLARTGAGQPRPETPKVPSQAGNGPLRDGRNSPHRDHSTARISPTPPRDPQVWRKLPPDRVNLDLLIRRATEDDWQPTGIGGVDIRRLFIDQERDQITMLVRMAAGTSYPGHLHRGPEECYVLHGDLQVGDTVLRTGDYQRAAGGSHHGVQSTSGGCTLLIVSSLSDELDH